MLAHDPSVFVVDDDDSIRDSLRWLIESINLHVETYQSANEFLQKGDLSQPGCLVLDVRMPGVSGLELQQSLTIQDIHIPIIIITGHGDVPMAVRAMKAGALDFIEKPVNDQMLLERIQFAIELDIKSKQEQAERTEILQQLEQLTRRERQVMDLLITGKPTKVIAADLELSCRTAEIYRGRVMEKMQAVSLCDLTRKAILAGATEVSLQCKQQTNFERIPSPND